MNFDYPDEEEVNFEVPLQDAEEPEEDDDGDEGGNPDAGVPGGGGGGQARARRFRPVQPIMGGINRISGTTEAAWTGGKPAYGWTGLEQVPTSILPSQYRPMSISSAAKSRAYRIQGLEIKFTRKSDLLTFQKKILNHMIDHGMDAISYIPSPNQQDMACIITEHARYTIEEAMNREAIQVGQYDDYDNANIKDAIKFLLNSLDEDLETQMYENCPEESSFIKHWMNLMLLVGSVSMDRFDAIKERIRSRKVQDYPGQNIPNLCSDYLADWKLLHGAKLYDNALTLVIADDVQLRRA